METKGLISVIIPVYNVEKYLRECVESVLKQTYQNFEIILVDDGSEDSSGDICDEYAEKDTRIRVIHKENGGASAARNAGLKEAAGEFVYFLDSDDWITESALEKMLGCMDGETDFTFCEAYAVDEITGNISTKNYSFHRDYGKGKPTDFFHEMTANKEFHVAVWMLLYRREFLERNGLRFVERIMYEDLIFAYQVYRLAKQAGHVHEYLYYRRYRSNSVMTAAKTSRNFVSAKKAYEEIISFWEHMGNDESDKPYLVRMAFNVLNNYRAMESADKRKYHADLEAFKTDVKSRGAFSDESLKESLRGKIFWILYKVRKKIMG